MKPVDIVKLDKSGSTKLADKLKKDLKIPDGWGVDYSKKGSGIRISKPGTDKGTRVRIMPGDPLDSFPTRREPYVEISVNGELRDINGASHKVPNDVTHIPLEDFEVPDWLSME